MLNPISRKGTAISSWLEGISNPLDAGEPGHHDADPDQSNQDVDDVPVRDRQHPQNEYERDGGDDHETVADGVRGGRR